MFSGELAMDMPPKEVEVIKARNQGNFLQLVIFALLIIALVAMLFGILSGDKFAYLAILLVFLTVMLPQLGGSRKYNELINILEKRLPQNTTMEDILSQELKKHNNTQ